MQTLSSESFLITKLALFFTFLLLLAAFYAGLESFLISIFTLISVESCLNYNCKLFDIASILLNLCDNLVEFLGAGGQQLRKGRIGN